MTSTHLHTEPQTEKTISDVVGIDTWKDPQVLDALLGGQQRAIDAVRLALPQIAVAANVIAERIRAGGRLIYAGAGTSIRIAVQDGSELPATFGMPEDQIAYLIAGGRAAMFDTLAEAEDDIADGQNQAGICTSGDVLVAVAASGATPFTVAAAERAKERKCFVVAVVNNPGSSLERLADVGILLESGPEVISGSTRMGAGTAQKAALNLMSTLAHIKLGAVHDGLMVNVQARNAKLMNRWPDQARGSHLCRYAFTAGGCKLTRGNWRKFAAGFIADSESIMADWFKRNQHQGRHIC
jgi:N-acetylmuramic acid 6-phosphate etherase